MKDKVTPQKMLKIVTLTVMALLMILSVSPVIANGGNGGNDPQGGNLRERACRSTYSVRPNDNVYLIAAMCDVPVDVLLDANGWIGDDLIIRPGDRLTIPQGDYGDITANTGGDFILTNRGPAYSPSGELEDAVVWGDLFSSGIVAGQGSGLPGTGGQAQVTGTVTATATVTSTATAQPTASPTAQATPLPGTGQQGNNQNQSGTQASDPNGWLMGMTLKEWRGRLVERECRSTYSVRPGDNLFIIAAMCDVPLDVLQDANRDLIGEDFIIRPGDRLNIPQGDYGDITANTGGDYILTNWGPVYSPTGRLADAAFPVSASNAGSGQAAGQSGGLPATGGQSQATAQPTAQATGTLTATQTVTGTATTQPQASPTAQATPLPGTGQQGNDQNQSGNQNDTDQSSNRLMGLSVEQWRDRLRERDCRSTYSVRPGDNVFVIAAMCDVPVDVLQDANRDTIGEDLIIRPGDRLNIPQGDYGDITAITGGDYILTNWGPVYSPTGRLSDAIP